MNTPFISRYVPARIKALTVSPGGSGTTLLMDFLAAHTVSNDPGDRDGLKHFAGPLLPLNPRCRVIYIYGDPVEMCISLFRRGYASHQSVKLTRRLVSVAAPVTANESIEAFARQGIDRLGFNAHFHRWLNTPRPYEVAFVRYDALWKSLPQVLKFLRLDPELARRFPARLDRHRADHLAAETIHRLEEIYAPLRREMAALGDFHLSPATRGVGRVQSWLGLARRAALPSLSWELSCRWPALHRPFRWLWRSAANPD